MRLRTVRPGYTLLEVILAFAISLLVLVALFVAMDTMLMNMEANREAIDESALGRALVSRVSADIASSLAPIGPAAQSASSSSTTTTTTTPSTTTPGTDGSQGGTTPDASTPGSTTPGSTTPSTTDPATTDPGTTTTTTSSLVFQIGVKGDASHVSIFHTRMTKRLVSPPDAMINAQDSYGCDIRRITYFVPDTDRGLARQEIRLVTGEEVDAVPNTADDGFTRIMAKEVQELTIRYFNGTDWVDSWDGSTPGPDGKTPQGPPRAVEITLGIQVPGRDELKNFTHVIAFPAAPGAPADTGTTPSTPTTP